MKYAFINANILDGNLDKNKKMPVKRGCVLVEDDKIISVSDSIPENLSGYEKIDINGKYLLPGLINMHVHLAASGKPSKPKKKPTNYKAIFDLLTSFPLIMKAYRSINEKNARDLLFSGVTTIRTVGGILDFDSTIRDNIKSGKIDGPRILASNMAISVPGGHFAGSLATEASSPDEAAGHVRKIAKSNPDLIKLMITGGVMDSTEAGEPGRLRMPPEYVKSACDEAHRLGYKVAAHIECTEGVKVALENGVDFIEHGANIDESLIKLFKERKAVQVCTLSPAIPYAKFSDSVYPISEDVRRNSNTVLEGIINCAKKCFDAGIPVGLGTDTACPYTMQYNTWRELYFWTELLGVSSDFALFSATKNNAELLGLGQITGTIECGKYADIIITENNPLEDINTLKNICMVMASGKLYKHPRVKKNKAVEKAFDLL